jgi:metallo-beta-lactamase family protein
MEAGVIPKVPVYADSPMALKALHFYRQAIDESSSEIRSDIVANWKNSDPFDAGTLVELPTVEDSMTINNPQVPCIIISASGMATGGRVLHHLKQMLPNPKHTVVLVGYQALGTRGRSMLDGAEYIKIHGALIKVKARIEQIDEFSVHADSEELLGWLRQAEPKPKQVFVVHGESGSAEVLAERIRAELKLEAVVPAAGESFPL